MKRFLGLTLIIILFCGCTGNKNTYYQYYKHANKIASTINFELNSLDENVDLRSLLIYYDKYKKDLENTDFTKPVIFILEYENSYPIVVSFFTGEDNAIFEKGTVIFDKNLKSEDITSALIWSNLELDKEIVQTLNWGKE